MKNGTYCHLELDHKSKDSIEDIMQYFQNTLSSSDLHCTLLCDDYRSFNINKSIKLTSKIIDIKFWSYEKDNKTKYNIVLLLDNKVSDLHNEIKNKVNGEHYMSPYIPHITISYDGDKKILNKNIRNKIIGTKLKFTNIKSKINNPNWKNKYLKE